MHTATQLSSASFEFQVDGSPSDLAGVFPAWTAADRFGIVLDRPLGSLGASLLIQAAVVAYFDVRPERRSTPSYPEIYAIHVGAAMGDHSFFDFWPPRKEVVVPTRAPIDVLAAVNSLGVTRLAVPLVAPGDVVRLEEGPNTWAEQSSARERIASCFAYDPAGSVDGAEVVIRSYDPRAEENAEHTLAPVAVVEQVLQTAGSEISPDTLRWAERVKARTGEVAESTRAELRLSRLQAAAATSTVRSETFRRLTLDEALAVISGLG